MLNICLLFRQSTYAYPRSCGAKVGLIFILDIKRNKLDLGLRFGLGNKDRKVMCMSGLRSLQEYGPFLHSGELYYLILFLFCVRLL